MNYRISPKLFKKKRSSSLSGRKVEVKDTESVGFTDRFGTVVTESIGGPKGWIVGVRLDRSGKYIDLPREGVELL